MPALRHRLPLLLLALAPPLSAAVLHVPAGYATISRALAAARGGDTILVAPGTYKESLDWPMPDGIRLIAPAGPTVTTIDASGMGRVIRFGRGLSRATLLQGFTVTGGLMKTSRNHGCGIYIQSSPTLRHNHIKGNVGDGTSWNYGGGIYIHSSATPRIERNLIEGNILRNGSWNYGAGIYDNSRGRAEIVGNRIVGNINEKGSRGYGGGIFVYGSKSRIVSNVIAGNICRSDLWNYGGGIRVYTSSDAEIVNNTIAGNQVRGGNWQKGGGIDYGGTRGSILNNIVAGNSAKSGGGIHGASGVKLDYNDVWNNNGGNYLICTAGPNDISKDPLFAGPKDHHLRPGSPCIDAASNNHVIGLAAIDLDGDPRLQDGDLDGKGGDGARADMGADEFNNTMLALASGGPMGKPVLFNVSGMTGGAGILLLSPNRGNAYVDPYGALLLGTPWLIVGRYTPPAKVPFFVAPNPLLVGISLHFQGITVLWRTQALGNTTNRVEVVLR